MRNLFLSLSTMALTAAVIGNAYIQKKQFYPSVVYITKSNPSMAVIYIQAFIVIWLVGKLMQKIFFGELRAAEIEHLMERFWYAITETCLAFTVFKDDFSPKFVVLCVVLLFLKTFHWLAEDRVDYMERSPVISWLFHTRIVLLLSLLGITDLFFISFAYHHTITKGASVQLVFGFEYAILLTVIINTAIKYVLHIIDMNREVFWENKAVFLLYVEVFIGLIKVILYFMFMVLMMKLYTLPLFAFRPMYYALRNFKKALNDVIQSRRAIRNMNTLYPDATTEELAAADNVCIICREEMQAGAKKLPCNHIFHVSCLRSWFQRHQTCPTCRLNVLRTSVPENNTNQQPAAPLPNQAPPPPFFPLPGFRPPFMPPPHLPPHLNLGQAPAQNIPAGPPPHPNAQAPGWRPDSQPRTENSSTLGASGFQMPDPSRQLPFSPFMFPPIPPFFPGLGSPPLPPQNWNGLSVEELREMEDSSRRGVEARLECLKNIHTLLDASVILMQQYVTSAALASATASFSMSTSHQTAEGNNQSGNSETSPQPSTSSNNNDLSTSQTHSSSPAMDLPSEKKNKEVVIDSQSTANTSSGNVNRNPSSPSTPTLIESPENSDEQEEIRRRRVQKFTSSS